jgi:fumarate hydratase, class II
VPVIGYDKASAIAHKANNEGTTLREAALASGDISAKDFDRVVDPRTMADSLKGARTQLSAHHVRHYPL